jgi:putative transcriptional regulator
MNKTYVLKNRVKELRSRLKMRQADLAREVDVTRQTILAIEKGRLNPSVFVSLKIARVLREPVGYIFYLDRVSQEEAVSQYPALMLEGALVSEDVTEAIPVYEFN